MQTAFPGSPEAAVGITVGSDGRIHVAAHECPDIPGPVPAHVYSIQSDGTTTPNWPVSSRAMYFAPALGSDQMIYQMDEFNVINSYHPDGSVAWAVGLPSFSQGVIALDSFDNLYVGTDSNLFGGHTVYSFTPLGTPRVGWPQDTGGITAQSTPAIADNAIYIANVGGSLYAFNSDGLLRPGFPFNAGGTISQQPLALSSSGIVYIKTSSGLFAVNPDGSSAWAAPFSPGGDATLSPGPIIDANGNIYVAFGNNVYSLNPDGSMRPGWPVTIPAAGYMVIGGNGVLYVISAGQKLYSITSGHLAFPLKGTRPGVDENLDPYRAPINSVFDHSMKSSRGIYEIYGCDSIVEAYTSELGNLDPSGKIFKIGCRQGYAQDIFHNPFYDNGHYVGGGDTTRLYYDGHPGIDYRAGFGTEVYAASAGTVHYPTNSELKKQNTFIGGEPDKFNALELDAESGLKIYYLHLSTHPRTISLHLSGDVTGQDFIATKTGTPGTTVPGVLTPQASFSISGQVTLAGKPLPGVTITLQGFTEKGACPSTPDMVTDASGNYRFSGLSAGFYNIRPSLVGYSFQAANPHVLVQDGTPVAAGTMIALSGNAGPCLPPHLHFEVQKKASEAVMAVTSLGFIPVDPYGWDGDGQDPYELVPGVKNDRLWAYLPLVNNISPSLVSAGIFELTVSGQGFESDTIDCLIMKSADYSSPSCIRGVVESRNDGQLVIRENLAVGTYFVHVENGDGHRSNWKKLVVQ
jgi:murein DD-endopeptidase MepM/ murein hydrolase activator NlpD